MYMVYAIVAVLSCIVGYTVGVFRTNKNNTRQSISIGNNLLIDARDNREIASIIHDSGITEKTKILEELVEIVNKAALDGRTFVCIETEYKSLNNRISRYLTKKDVLDLFDKSHYTVDFRWYFLDDADISRISW